MTAAAKMLDPATALDPAVAPHDPRHCAGVDEAGRGPLAGPVIAAAVILGADFDMTGLADSKTMSERKRTEMATYIWRNALACAVGRAEHAEIDRRNILNASLLAMRRAVEGLSARPRRVLVDGNHCPRLPDSSGAAVEAIVKGDQKVPCISAASIIAKVTRDREMARLDAVYPGYGFARHKGYPTKEHLRALQKHGACPIHRRSYRPVRECIEGSRARPDRATRAGRALCPAGASGNPVALVAAKAEG